MNLSFYPHNISGKLFKTYIKSFQHPAKVRILNFIGSIFFKNGIQLTNTDGLVFQLEANDWITRIIIEQNCYEKSSLKLSQKILENGGIFLDIGANFGLFSCILSKNPLVRTYSFEPNYDVVKTLIKNISINNISNAAVINIAVGKQNQLVFFSVPEHANKGTGRYTNSKAKEETNGIYVGAFSLEEVISELDIPFITLIKIDIEGNEMNVFRDFNFNKLPVHNIIMEYNENAKISFNELKSFFESNHYILKNVNGDLLNNEENIIENNIWLEKGNR